MRYSWPSSGGSSGRIGSPVQLFEQPLQAAIITEHSTGCTGTIVFDTAMESTGPWATLGSTTTNSSLAEIFQYLLTGPFGRWIQPRFSTPPTTGSFRVTVMTSD